MLHIRLAEKLNDTWIVVKRLLGLDNKTTWLVFGKKTLWVVLEYEPDNSTVN